MQELNDQKQRIAKLESCREKDSELEIKKELNTFETLLQCEETRLGIG